MKRAIATFASVVVMCVATAAGQPSGSAAGPVASAMQQEHQCRAVIPVTSVAVQSPNVPGGAARLSHYDSRVQASFVARLDADRRARLLVKSSDLDVEKVVSPDGSFTVTLKTADDVVVVATQKATLDVARNDVAVHLELGQATDDDLLAIQVLLAGSRAVRLHHLLAANLDPATRTRPGGAATLLTDAFLGFLGGDVAAFERLGRDLARRRPPAPTVVRARFRREATDSCYVRWENEVTEAWYQLVACRLEYSPFNPLQQVCNLRYYMRTECAWWELISCCAIPLRAE